MNYQGEDLTRVDLRVSEVTDQIEQNASAAALSASGAGGTLVGYDSGGNLISVLIQGDPGNGLDLQILANTLTATLSQDLSNGGQPEFDGIRINAAGTLIKRISSGTVSADPGSIIAQTRGSVTATITGVASGDVVILNPPGALNTGLVYGGCEVTGADTITIYLANLTGGAIDDGSQAYRYLWLDLT